MHTAESKGVMIPYPIYSAAALRAYTLGAVSVYYCIALGTARCAELDYQEGAFSSLALVICGIFTSLLAPFLFPLLLALWG